jgi:hypothetical protein
MLSLLRAYAPSAGYSSGQELVLGALPTESASQSTGILPEAAEVSCSQQTQVVTQESHDQEEPFLAVEGCEFFSDNVAELG